MGLLVRVRTEQVVSRWVPENRELLLPCQQSEMGERCWYTHDGDDELDTAATPSVGTPGVLADIVTAKFRFKDCPWGCCWHVAGYCCSMP